MRDGAALPMRWQVERDGRIVDVEVLPRVLDDNGTAIGRVDAFIGQPVEMVTVQRGLWEGLQLGVDRTWELSVLTMQDARAAC